MLFTSLYTIFFKHRERIFVAKTECFSHLYIIFFFQINHIIFLIKNKLEKINIFDTYVPISIHYFLRNNYAENQFSSIRTEKNCYCKNRVLFPSLHHFFINKIEMIFLIKSKLKKNIIFCTQAQHYFHLYAIFFKK